jgi:hypothetical protein
VSTDVQEPPPEATEPDVTASEAALGPPDVIADSLGEYVKIWISRVRNGESGALPVILGLVAIVIYFQARSSLFLSAGNLVNLTTQAAFIIMLGMSCCSVRSTCRSAIPRPSARRSRAGCCCRRIPPRGRWRCWSAWPSPRSSADSRA